MFGFLVCPFSIVLALISLSEFCGINAEYVREVRRFCGFCQECSKLVELVGFSKGRTRSSVAMPGAATLTAPAERSGVTLKISL